MVGAWRRFLLEPSPPVVVVVVVMVVVVVGVVVVVVVVVVTLVPSPFVTLMRTFLTKPLLTPVVETANTSSN